MVNVSKKKLPEEAEKKLLKQLGSIIVAQQSSKDSESLLYELFTRSERTVFIKRVGIIALLQEDYSPHTIGLALNVSQTTVSKIQAALERGRYKNIATTLNRKKHRESIIGVLESLLTLGMPGEANRRIKSKLREDIVAWKSGAR